DVLAEPAGKLLRVSDRLIAAQKEGMPDLLLTPLTLHDPAVEFFEEFIKREVPDLGSGEQFGVRHELHESEPPAQCAVEKLDAAVCRVHGSDDVDVRRNREGLLALGQRDRDPSL